MLRILVVDDEKLSRETTAFQLREAGYTAEPFASPLDALKEITAQPWDVVLTDLRMPEMTGLELLRKVKACRPEASVILMTAHGSVKTAVEAMHEGAVDYLIKPYDFDELKIRLERFAEVIGVRRENAALRKALGGAAADGLVGHSAGMGRVRDLIRQFAGLPSNVLIAGETGTGKEVVARAVHGASAFASGPFVAVGCAAVPKELAESELFGHEAGAFTGATKRRKGRVELSEGGTLFLDDVDDLSLDIQAKLLRVIQERSYERVGGEKAVQANIRVVAATKFPLEDLVKQGKFRDDLMYRLSVLTIPLPPLRERREDIPLLVRHFLDLFGRERKQEPKAVAPAALEYLQAYVWPGNIRELRHALEYALAVSKTAALNIEDLPAKIKPGLPERPYALNLDGKPEVSFREMTENFERDLIQWALGKADGNQGRAAQLLGIPRSTLQFKLSEKAGEKPRPEPGAKA
ncbi:MAG: sigma-54-dependent Fis family transcriptional regulator [Planctomycetes bacterium]|nr:sigma-54-dependent Fis family transcriptional regulator [Planctomycetota bacterium]